MDYQHLLNIHKDLTIRASDVKFILNNIEDNSRERKLFLCLLLGYHISHHDELSNQFPSGSLFDAFEGYKQQSLPPDSKVQMCTAITTLVQHNAFQYQFHWLKIFIIAAEVDPEYTFIDRLNTLKYPNDDLLSKFIKELEIISPHIKKIEFDIYVKISKVKNFNIL